jgi:hypothetical protein
MFLSPDPGRSLEPTEPNMTWASHYPREHLSKQVPRDQLAQILAGSDHDESVRERAARPSALDRRPRA